MNCRLCQPVLQQGKQWEALGKRHSRSLNVLPARAQRRRVRLLIMLTSRVPPAVHPFAQVCQRLPARLHSVTLVETLAPVLERAWLRSDCKHLWSQQV